MNTLRRLQRLLRLDLSALDEAAADQYATIGSLAVAVVSMFLLGVGGWLWWVRSGLPDAWGVLVSSAFVGSVFGIALWLLWLLIAYMLINRLTGRAPRIDALTRACGLAAAPLALGVLMAIPVVSFAIGLVALAAWVVVTQAALERATGAPTGVALTANLAGFAVWAGVMSVLSAAQQQFAPGPFLAESLWDAIAAFDAAQALVGG